MFRRVLPRDGGRTEGGDWGKGNERDDTSMIEERQNICPVCVREDRTDGKRTSVEESLQ